MSRQRSTRQDAPCAGNLTGGRQGVNRTAARIFDNRRETRYHRGRDIQSAVRSQGAHGAASPSPRDDRPECPNERPLRHTPWTASRYVTGASGKPSAGTRFGCQSPTQSPSTSLHTAASWSASDTHAPGSSTPRYLLSARSIQVRGTSSNSVGCSAWASHPGTTSATPSRKPLRPETRSSHRSQTARRPSPAASPLNASG